MTSREFYKKSVDKLVSVFKQDPSLGLVEFTDGSKYWQINGHYHLFAFSKDSVTSDDGMKSVRCFDIIIPEA